MKTLIFKITLAKKLCRYMTYQGIFRNTDIINVISHFQKETNVDTLDLARYFGDKREAMVFKNIKTIIMGFMFPYLVSNGVKLLRLQNSSWSLHSMQRIHEAFR